MAIIHCPACGKRISSLMSVCPHCETVLGEVSPEEHERLARRRWKKKLYRAANLSYLALTMLVVGALWWWFTGDDGWVLPPPAVAISLIIIGAAMYVVARGWLFWLRLGSNRP